MILKDFQVEKIITFCNNEKMLLKLVKKNYFVLIFTLLLPLNLNAETDTVGGGGATFMLIGATDYSLI